MSTWHLHPPLEFGGAKVRCGFKSENPRDIVIQKTFASNISGSVAVKLRPQLLVRSLVPVKTWRR
jgi:hypothetical protein